MEDVQFYCTVITPDSAVLVAAEAPAVDLAKASLLEDCQGEFLEFPRQVAVDIVGVALMNGQGLRRLQGCDQRLRKKHAAR